jgi:hypothetical protein
MATDRKNVISLAAAVGKFELTLTIISWTILRTKCEAHNNPQLVMTSGIGNTLHSHLVNIFIIFVDEISSPVQ